MDWPTFRPHSQIRNTPEKPDIVWDKVKPVPKPAPSVETKPVKSSFIGSSPTRNLNDQTANILILVIALSVIPYASLRPFFWTLWAVALGGIAFGYFTILTARRYKLRVSLKSFWPFAVPFALVAAWMVIQIVPFGAVFGPVFFSTQTGTEIASNTLSLSPGDTTLALLRWLTYGALFFLTVQVSFRASRARKLLWAFLIITVLQALYAFFALYYLGDTNLIMEKEKYFGDATGTFLNRNTLATYLAFGAVIATALAIPTAAIEEQKGKRKSQLSVWLASYQSHNLLALACLGVLLAALLATHSRMGFAAGMCGVLATLMVRLPDNRQRLILAGATVTAVAIGLAFYGDGLLTRLFRIADDTAFRANLYDQVWQMIGDRPLLGFGADGFVQAYPLYHAPPVPTVFTFYKAHSTYLANWLELGVVFGTLPILIVAAFLVKMLSQVVVKKIRKAEASVAVGVIVIAAIHSLVDFSLEIQAVTMLFTALMAVGMSDALRSESSS